MTSPVPAISDHQPGLLARSSAEALGTMFVVFVAAGVAILSSPAAAPLPAALATGLTVTAAMVAFGYISGGHFNPVITLGNLIAGRIRAVPAVAYIAAQVVGGIVGAALVYLVVMTVPVLTDARQAFGSATQGYGQNAAAQTQLAGVLLVEVVGSAVLVAVFLGATAGRRALPVLAPFAVGLSVAVLLQFGQVLGNLPFNPARATAQALFGPSWAMESLWLFWVAPLMGAALAGLAFRGFRGFSTASAASGAELDNVDAEDDAETDAEGDVERLGDEGAVDGAGPETAGAAAPSTRANDDARDFFDGRKG